MSKRLTYVDICKYLAARQCWNSGQSIKEIAKSAQKSPATIRRWIKATGVTKL